MAARETRLCMDALIQLFRDCGSRQMGTLAELQTKEKKTNLCVFSNSFVPIAQFKKDKSGSQQV